MRSLPKSPSLSTLPTLWGKGAAASAGGIRVRQAGCATSTKGANSERAAREWFEVRGHTVKDVSQLSVMHDFEVTQFGRVQVKTMHLHREAGRSNRFVATLRSGSSGRRYPLDAFDWLCCVYWLKSGEPRILLVKEVDLVVAGKPYLSSRFVMSMADVVNRWSPVNEVDLWGAA